MIDGESEVSVTKIAICVASKEEKKIKSKGEIQVMRGTWIS